MTLAPRTDVKQLLEQPEITEAVFIARELSKAYRMGDVEYHILSIALTQISGLAQLKKELK